MYFRYVYVTANDNILQVELSLARLFAVRSDKRLSKLANIYEARASLSSTSESKNERKREISCKETKANRNVKHLV